MSAYDRVRERLAERTGSSGRNGMWRCPAHHDRTPSLSVKCAADGSVLMHCHRGCDTARVVDAIGLEMKDLFEPNRNGRHSNGSEPTARYPYTDESGALLYEVLRKLPKRFSQRRPDGNGGWIYNLDGVRRVPYRLPDVIDAVKEDRWVLIVEGEKDVETLRRFNIVATTNSGGAGKWSGDWARQYFANAKVCVLPDNDDGGREHAIEVAKSLFGVARELKVVELPGLGPKGDVSDWFADGHDVKELVQLVKGAPAWKPALEAPPEKPDAVEDGAALLDELARFVERFVVFPNEHYTTAITLWIAHTHCIDAFEITPRLALISETKHSGKSRALEVIDLTAARSRYVGSMSIAYLFRVVSTEKPTLLFDEIDAVFGPKARDNEELRALINVGFRRSATVGRCVGDGSRQTPTEFAVFAPLALAGIGANCLPDTVLDRSVVLRMRRRVPGEPVEPLRLRRTRPQAEALRDRLAGWAEAQLDELAAADPAMPEGVTDRPADTWEALLAVADAADGEWPTRARAACVALNDARVRGEQSVDSTPDVHSKYPRR